MQRIAKLANVQDLIRWVSQVASQAIGNWDIVMSIAILDNVVNKSWQYSLCYAWLPDYGNVHILWNGVLVIL